MTAAKGRGIAHQALAGYAQAPAAMLGSRQCPGARRSRWRYCAAWRIPQSPGGCTAAPLQLCRHAHVHQQAHQLKQVHAGQMQSNYPKTKDGRKLAWLEQAPGSSLQGASASSHVAAITLKMQNEQPPHIDHTTTCVTDLFANQQVMPDCAACGPEPRRSIGQQPDTEERTERMSVRQRESWQQPWSPCPPGSPPRHLAPAGCPPAPDRTGTGYCSQRLPQTCPGESPPTAAQRIILDDIEGSWQASSADM